MNNIEKLDPSALVALKLSAIKNMTALNFFDENKNYYEFILRYQGNIKDIADEVSFEYIDLYGGFAIIFILPENIQSLVINQRVLYIDVPKRIYYEDIVGIENEYNSSCMNFRVSSRGLNSNLDGRGVLVSIIDSGVDIKHPIFEGMNIVEMWNQNINGMPPYNYRLGSIVDDMTDESGHGTSVASILYRCVPKAEFLIVKLLDNDDISYSSSFMLAVDYSIRKSIELNKPLVINISYGNNYGDHDGGAILEEYLDTVASYSKNTIVCGSGNEGNSAKHAGILLNDIAWKKVEILANEFQTAFTLQIWKSYIDTADFFIELPSGEEIGPFNSKGLVYDYLVDNMRIFAVVSEISPFSRYEQIFISVIPLSVYIEAGIWLVKIKPKGISDGKIDMWLPAAAASSSDISFLIPDIYTSLTIPSTASNVITVGAYNVSSLSIALFSGRGYTKGNRIKPDIAAPGVNVLVAIPPDDYVYKSGTSFATPFVSAGAAMLMQWGIVDGNDPFLFGNKVKEKLISGAKELPGYNAFPNSSSGYGVLCVEDSL